MTFSTRWAIAGLLMLCCACSADSSPTVPAGKGKIAKRKSKPGARREVPAPKGPYWPRFHGPDGANKSADTGLLKKWPDGGPKLIWTAEGIGHGFSSVTIADGLIYTDGNLDGKTVVTALDLDGKLQWQKPNGKAWTGSHKGTRGTPTYDEGRLYHESPLGELVAMDAKTGKKVWGFNILEKFKGKNIAWALAESVLIDGEHLICCPGGRDGSVVALDKKTGETVWAAPGTGQATSYASPALVVHEGRRMVLTMNAEALLAVDADTGALLLQYPHKTEYDVNALMPVYHDGCIFISSGYGSGSELVRLTADGDKVAAQRVWKQKQLDNHHGGVILLDGYIYGSSSRGKWICLDWKTGDVKYSTAGVGKGSVTFADGMLYTFSENRKMGLVRPGPDAHEVVSQFMVPSGGPGKSWAHPVVCGGRLYLRHSDKLYAYDVKAK